MSRVLALSGSPSTASRTALVLAHLSATLAAGGHEVTHFAIRDLPPAALLRADGTEPAIAAVIDAVDRADGLIIASPIYKASYTGLLKSLLDLLPQYALGGKVVLPLATGGSLAHALAVDYALRPVLAALGAHHIVPGYFVLDRLITTTPDGVRLAAPADDGVRTVLDGFRRALSASVPVTA